MLFCFPSQFSFGFSGIFYALFVPLRTLILVVSNIASTELSSSLSDAVVFGTLSASPTRDALPESENKITYALRLSRAYSAREAAFRCHSFVARGFPA